MQRDTYKLEPRFDRAKSFYGKAQVIETDDKIILESYRTQVCEITRNSNTAEILGFYSTTTLRHIKDFLYQHGFKISDKQGLYYMYTEKGKKEFLELEKKNKEKLEKQRIKEIEKMKRLEKKKERENLKKEKLTLSLKKELSEYCSKEEFEKILNFELSQI